MKITRCIGVAMLIAFVGSPGDASAQPGLEITPQVGAAFFLSDLPEQLAVSDTRVLEGAEFFDRALSLGMAAGLRLSDALTVEAAFSWHPVNLRADDGLRHSVDSQVWDYGVNGLFALPALGSARPFVGLGVGRTTIEYGIANSDNRSEWTAKVLAGLLMEASERSAFRIQVSDQAMRYPSGVTGVDDTWSNRLSISFGLSMRPEVG